MVPALANYGTMTQFNFFGRRNETQPAYSQVFEDEDKLLDEPTHATSAELEKLKRANANLKRILGIIAGFFVTFLALIAYKGWHSRGERLMYPQILKTPVPQSKEVLQDSNCKS